MYLSKTVAAARVASAAAAAGVIHPSFLAASFHAANFAVPNNVENHKEITNVLDRNPSVNSNVMLLPPYINPFNQVSNFITKNLD
jgi:hypothetical protein